MILLEKTRKNDDIPDDYIADGMKYPQIWDAILLIHKLTDILAGSMHKP